MDVPSCADVDDARLAYRFLDVALRTATDFYVNALGFTGDLTPPSRS
jgi:hypothetical protein